MKKWIISLQLLLLSLFLAGCSGLSQKEPAVKKPASADAAWQQR